MIPITNKYQVWKQPIPTNLNEIFGEDYRCMVLYKELIYRANNSDNAILALGLKTVRLMRGQVLYGRHKFAKYLCWNDLTTDRALIKLEKLYKLVHNQRTMDYTIVTLLNYDDIISMNTPLNNKRTRYEQLMNTSKNDKNSRIINNNTFTSGNMSSGKRRHLPRPEVNFVLKVFCEVFKLSRPSDNKPRWWAYHIARELPPEKITKLIKWVYSQEWGKTVDKLQTIYKKIPIFEREDSKVISLSEFPDRGYKNAASIRSH